ncbi:MAG: hypothetical protein ACE10B_05190, partial [Phycisphaerales bacterium]
RAGKAGQVALTGNTTPGKMRDYLKQDVLQREHEFKRLPYPITDELFVVTRDGVAGTKAA